ncbi:hypothetical protein RJZ57_008540 [Blastomyces gilchristii]
MQTEFWRDRQNGEEGGKPLDPLDMAVAARYLTPSAVEEYPTSRHGWLMAHGPTANIHHTIAGGDHLWSAVFPTVCKPGAAGPLGGW